MLSLHSKIVLRRADQNYDADALLSAVSALIDFYLNHQDEDYLMSMHPRV